MITATPTTIKLSTLEFDFGSSDEYSFTQEEQDTLTADWLNTNLHPELNTNSTIQDYTRTEVEAIVADYISDNSGWCVAGFTIDWDQRVVPDLAA